MTDNMKCIRADLCKKFYGVKTTDECTGEGRYRGRGAEPVSKGSCAVCLHYDWMKEECKLTDCEYVMAAEVLDCAYKKLCKVNDTKNCVHKDSWECPMADKIRDALNDAVPFYDPDEDLPEEDEEEP